MQVAVGGPNNTVCPFAEREMRTAMMRRGQVAPMPRLPHSLRLFNPAAEARAYTYQ